MAPIKTLNIVDTNQKSHLFSALTRSFSESSQLANENHVVSLRQSQNDYRIKKNPTKYMGEFTKACYGGSGEADEKLYNSI